MQVHFVEWEQLLAVLCNHVILSVTSVVGACVSTGLVFLTVPVNLYLALAQATSAYCKLRTWLKSKVSAWSYYGSSMFGAQDTSRQLRNTFKKRASILYS